MHESTVILSRHRAHYAQTDAARHDQTPNGLITYRVCSFLSLAPVQCPPQRAAGGEEPPTQPMSLTFCHFKTAFTSSPLYRYVHNNQLNSAGVNKLEPIRLQLINTPALRCSLKWTLDRLILGKPILTGDATACAKFNLKIRVELFSKRARSKLGLFLDQTVRWNWMRRYLI